MGIEVPDIGGSTGAWGAWMGNMDWGPWGGGLGYWVGEGNWACQ